MCRLMFIPMGTRWGSRRLKTQFEYLEETSGGDGNGLALIPLESREVEIIKGVDINAERCSLLAADAIDSGMHVLFHTRLSSSGNRGDKQCHPFYISNDKSNCVAHNGHWEKIASLAKIYSKEMSDTQFFARAFRILGRNKLMELGLWPTTGVWMYCGVNDCAVEYFSGELLYDLRSGIWSSDFAPGIGVQEVRVKTGLYDMLLPLE